MFIFYSNSNHFVLWWFVRTRNNCSDIVVLIFDNWFKNIFYFTNTLRMDWARQTATILPYGRSSKMKLHSQWKIIEHVHSNNSYNAQLLCDFDISLQVSFKLVNSSIYPLFSFKGLLSCNWKAYVIYHGAIAFTVNWWKYWVSAEAFDSVDQRASECLLDLKPLVYWLFISE